VEYTPYDGVVACSDVQANYKMVCYTLCLGSVRFRNRGGKLKFKQTKNRLFWKGSGT